MAEQGVPKPNSLGEDPYMIQLGDIARRLRESKGITQLSAANLLGITNVYLCNIEANKAQPSRDLLARYRELWKVDLYVLAWCLSGDVEKLPARVQQASRKLTDAWRKELGELAVPEGR
jgi:transcriptional regulator with XRE-family HTH domain